MYWYYYVNCIYNLHDNVILANGNVFMKNKYININKCVFMYNLIISNYLLQIYWY